MTYAVAKQTHAQLLLISGTIVLGGFACMLLAPPKDLTYLHVVQMSQHCYIFPCVNCFLHALGQQCSKALNIVLVG